LQGWLVRLCQALLAASLVTLLVFFVDDTGLSYPVRFSTPVLPGSLAAQYAIMQPRETRLIVEVTPSGKPVTVEFIDEDELKRLLRGEAYRPLALFENVTGVDYAVTLNRSGVYGVLVRNKSGYAVSVKIIIVQSGGRIPTYMTLTGVSVACLLTVLAARLVERWCRR